MFSRAFLVLVFVLVPGVVVAAEPLVDRNGDPLPEGAVARFGSARLLHGGVQHLQFSPDGKVLATSGAAGVRLWDVATGRALVAPHLPGWDEAVFAFTPYGGHLVGDADGCRLVDSATGKVRCSWAHGDRLPRAFAVAADGKWAATAWRKGGVTVHSLGRGGQRDDWLISEDYASDLCLSGDGGLLAYAAQTKEATSVLLWDARKGKRLHTYTPQGPPSGRFNSLALSRDGRRLAASWGRAVCLWDTTTHEEVKGFSRPEVEAVHLRFSADGSELSAVSPRPSVWRWSVASGQELAHSCTPREAGHPHWYSTLSADGRTVATSYGSAVLLWDAATWKELAPVERWSEWRGAAFVGPGVAATHTAGKQPEVLAFWEPATGRLLRKRSLPVPESGWWRRELSPDGKLFAAENEKKGILLFDVGSGKEVGHLDPPRRKDEQAKFAFHPDGKAIVTTDYPRGLAVWDVATGKPLRWLEGVSDGVMTFAPDGRIVASAFVGRLCLTEVASGKVRHQLRLPTNENDRDSSDVFGRIRFAKDGRSVVAVSAADLLVFSTIRGSRLLHVSQKSEPHFSNEETTGDLSPDGRWLAHADNYRRAVVVRDLKNPRAATEYQVLPGHAGQVNAVAFSPDGKHLLSCSSDGTALVWDVARFTGKPPPERPRRLVPDVDALVPPGVEPYWAALADGDPSRAVRAMAALELVPGEAVALLGARLKPAAPPPPGRVERLIADLDSDAFVVREKAFEELGRYAELAEPALRQALAGKPSAELTQRSEQLLAALSGRGGNPEQLRQLRAVEVLEWIGTRSAREVLEALAKGAPGARLTQEAKASLARWPSR